jgi:hypothetical protein
MLVHKAHRHEAAWQQYCASRDVARQQHDTAAAMAAAVLKAALDGISGDVEQQMSVLAEDKVMLLSEQQILQVSREQLFTVATCPASTNKHLFAAAVHALAARAHFPEVWNAEASILLLLLAACCCMPAAVG